MTPFKFKFKLFPPNPFGPRPEPASTISLSPTSTAQRSLRASTDPAHEPPQPSSPSPQPARRSPSSLDRLTSGTYPSAIPLPPFSRRDPKLLLRSAPPAAPLRFAPQRSAPQQPGSAPTASPLARSAKRSPTAAPLLFPSSRSFFPFSPRRGPARSESASRPNDLFW
jgi:hypothetical protein